MRRHFDYGGIGIGVAADQFDEEASPIVESNGDGLGVFDEMGARQYVSRIVPDDTCSDCIASVRHHILRDLQLLGDGDMHYRRSDDGEDFRGSQAGVVGARGGWLRRENGGSGGRGR